MNWLRFNEPLTKHCTLRVGGSVYAWAQPENISQLVDTLNRASSEDKNAHIVGLGSNSLFNDGLTDAYFIRLQGDFCDYSVKEHSPDGITVYIGAGMINAHLVREFLKHGWVGAEFLTLIPGTFGGSVVMNAGTKEQELSSIVIAVDMLVYNDDEQCWERQCASAKALSMSYRHTALPSNAVVLGATLRVQPGDVSAAKERVAFDKARRNETQPYRLASVGSTFANPAGDYAGRLIESVGLKGHSIGGAQISPHHANFFINRDNATANDFISLMALARYRVRESLGVELRPEVRFVGFDGWNALAQMEQQLSQAISLIRS